MEQREEVLRCVPGVRTRTSYVTAPASHTGSTSTVTTSCTDTRPPSATAPITGTCSMDSGPVPPTRETESVFERKGSPSRHRTVNGG